MDIYKFIKQRKQNQNISFQFFAAPPCTPRRFLRIRKFLVLRGAEDERRQAECVRLRAHGVCRSEDKATPRRGKVSVTTLSERKRKFRVSTRSARASYQSLRDCCSKKVRAKVTISPPNETSCSVRAWERRAEGAQEGRKPRRVATKWLGEETEKWAVLSLVSYLKYNFYQF